MSDLTVSSILKPFKSPSGRKILVDVSEKALSPWDLKHGQAIITHCGCETTVAGVALCGGENCGKMACNVPRLWLLNADGLIRHTTLGSRESLTNWGYEIID